MGVSAPKIEPGEASDRGEDEICSDRITLRWPGIPSRDTLRSSLRKGGNDAKGSQDVDPPQATTFYNRMGAKQDWQAFYEAPATRDLIAHAFFETTQSVFEFGCGTGAFAELVLAHHLPPQAKYLAVDSSATMVCLAQARLERFGGACAATMDLLLPGVWFL